MKSTFLWPTTFSDMHTISFNGSKIESFFDQIFYPYKTIYLSQARHFIPLILKYLGFSRNDIIFTAPYSSHCVLSNIGLQSTPTIQTHISDIDASIIYHQYGRVEKVAKTKYPNIILEDSVDSFIVDVSEKSIFPNDANFTIISLSKILPLPFGGIMICKNWRDYEKVEKMINKDNTNSFPTELFTQVNYLRETILERYQRVVPKIDNIETLYEDTKNHIKSNCSIVQNLFNLKIDLSKRLPSNILSDDFSILDRKEYKYLKIEAPIRHIFDYNNGSIKKKY